MLGSTWNYDTTSAGTRAHRARRRREKQGWTDVDDEIREARVDEVHDLLQRGTWPTPEHWAL
jgi:hypothetical protein